MHKGSSVGGRAASRNLVAWWDIRIELPRAFTIDLSISHFTIKGIQSLGQGNTGLATTHQIQRFIEFITLYFIYDL